MRTSRFVVSFALLLVSTSPSTAALLGSFVLEPGFAAPAVMDRLPIDLDVCIETGDFSVPPGRDFCRRELGGAVLFDARDVGSIRSSA